MQSEFLWRTSWETTTLETEKETEDHIKKDLSDIGCEDGRWMELAQDRVQ
jgi:hypothetical protein